MSELSDLFDKYSSVEAGSTDKNSYHSYSDFYAKLFEPIRHSVTRVLEVGVRGGGSLKAWSEYFPQAHIFGIDNGLEAGIWKPDGPNADRIHVAYADTFKPQTIHDLFCPNDESTTVGCEWRLPFDIIIDDGCHNVVAQAATWAMLFPYAKTYYVVEDIEGIDFAIALQRHFGGVIEDRRIKKQRHDDLLLYWRKD